MKAYKSLLSLSCVATTAVAAGKLVGFDDGQINAADAPVKGWAENPAQIGEPYAAMVQGFGSAVATGAIAKGAKLVSSPNGGVQAVTGEETNIFAVALTDAADGKSVEFLIR